MIEGLEDAIRAREQRQYDVAEQRFADLLAAYPDDALTNFHYAWLCDAQGLEQRAVGFYERAIDLGLPPEDLRGALLGLGSTYRALGEYQKAAARLQRGLVQFPEALEFTVFYAMVLYNLGQHQEATSRLLRLIADQVPTESIARYQRAIHFYAQDLDKTWKEE
jgi:tetratricopeptide (TPR) repeat protein